MKKRSWSGLGVVALSLAATLGGGCGADFDPASRLTSLRVVAIQADKPWASPGEEVNLQALWYVPKDKDTMWAWTTCVNPDSSTVVGCFLKIAKDLQAGRPPAFALGKNKDTWKFTVPSTTLSELPEAARKNSTVGIITIVCPGDLKLPGPDAPPPTTGSLPFQCIGDDGVALGTDQFVAGIKRIFVRSKDRNQNPVIASVTWDGQPWAEDFEPSVAPCDTTENRYDRCGDAESHEIAVTVTPGSFEAGTDEFGSPFTEQLVVQYYATEGLFEHDVRVAREPASRWVARKQAAGSTLDVWLVARDNRGGVVWATRKIKVK